MLFYLSKLVGVMISPLIWIIALLTWSWITKRPRQAKFARVLGFILLLVFTNPWLSNWALTNWEYPSIGKDELPLVETAVILGGMITTSTDYPQDQIGLNASSERLLEGLRLYKSKIVRRLIISGGNGNLMGNEQAESIQLAELSNDLIRRVEVHLDTLSRNTHENALETKRILQELDITDQQIVLITSAYHMRRAIMCFRKEGISFIPYPVDQRSTGRMFTPSYLIPTSTALDTWNILFKEWVGILAYELFGYA